MSEESVPSIDDNLNKEDALKAKREARRRKILENATSRLEKLNGGQNNDLATQEIYPDPEIELAVDNRNDGDFFGGGINRGGGGGINFENNLQNLNPVDLLHLFDQFAKLTENTGGFSTPNASPHNLSSDDLNFQNNIFFGGNQQQQQQQQQNHASEDFISKIIKHRLHLILLAFITYTLCCMNDKVLVFSVFMPLLIVEVLEIVFLKTAKSSTASLLNIALLLAGISPVHSQIMLKLLDVINKLLKDISFFLFFFVIYHLMASNFFGALAFHGEI